MATVRIASAQAPEFRGNVQSALAYAAQVMTGASALGVRLLCFPECFLQGYLLDEDDARQHALDLSSPVFRSMAAELPLTDMIVVIGMIETSDGNLFNSAALIQNGAVKGVYRKTHLLRSESFFAPGTEVPVFSVDGLSFGVNICYDTNFPAMIGMIADQGGMLIVCPANNMMPRQRAETYRNVHNVVRANRCRERGIWLVSSDIFGERDGRVSWGPTAVIDPAGQVVAQLELGKAGLLIFDIPLPSLK
ncbi:putative amidohydrolase [Agrobacterium tumefaciens]|uniref:Amidohydrolase n=1 Tax=Agrobacterium radiobacter TaxID=362 RepID=A0ABR6J6P7_AGRRD|nr:carbon-nitrogen hydrolase family protein [Agrobacterium radiobacter]TGE76525.1 carbon-nitrogen hydrolase family protein [Rhizobium sp. SEMIA 439]MBB4283891.1 putative amidohydrolase [Agrobacterium radiobacter]MBB4319613.1 putative amidohydrolase [Agrobacterium radiobacter]MBB4326000.1 putative amidohydrolase [Agrobacterium radiobacter]MBB4337855.1 putative amidohydrolase [Agrobacterium radiobacter]